MMDRVFYIIPGLWVFRTFAIVNALQDYQQVRTFSHEQTITEVKKHSMFPFKVFMDDKLA